MTKVLYIYEKMDKSFVLIKKLNNNDCQLETIKFTAKTFLDTEVINSFDLLIIDIEINLIDLFIGEISRFLTPSIFILNQYDEKIIHQLITHNIQNIKIKPINLADIKSSIFLLAQKSNLFHNNMPLQIIDIVKYIDKNITTKIELEEIQGMTNWNYAHFIRTFKKHTHYTPYQYILKQKVKFAQKLLIESDFNLKEISVMLSFGSYSNFVNAFTKETKETPHNYKHINKSSRLN